MKFQHRFNLEMLVSVFFVLSGCVVTNNLYLNDPVPLAKDKNEFYIGGGIGLVPTIDSVAANGEAYSHNFHRAGLALMGAKIRASDQISVYANFHLPQIIGGAGFVVRPQYSFLPRENNTNLAFAIDLGGVVAGKGPGDDDAEDDSNKYDAKGAINADFSLPASISFSQNTRIIITPRYSYDLFYLRKSYTSERSKKRFIQYPALSIGLKTKDVHIEASALRLSNYTFYTVGMAFILKWDNQSAPVDMDGQ